MTLQHDSARTRLPLALPCRCAWTDTGQPAEPEDFVSELPAELRKLRSAGAVYAEFHADLCVLDERYGSPEVWKQVAALLEQANMGATVHLPFMWTDLTALDTHVWEGSIRSVQAACEAVEPLNPRLAAVHPANYATQMLLGSLADPTPLLMHMAGRLVAALSRLQEGPCGQVVALENLEGIPVQLFAQVVGLAGAKVCLDIGHVISNGDDPQSVVRMLGDRILGIHLHDAVAPQGDQDGRAHLPLGQGELDLDGLSSTLEEVGFNGPTVLEVEGDWGQQLAAAKLLGLGANS